MPYQTLINLYLKDCARNKKEPNLSWASNRIPWSEGSALTITVDTEPFLVPEYAVNRTIPANNKHEEELLCWYFLIP